MTISLKELKCTPDTLREAIAEANGLACGRVEVAHVAHLDPVTRFLRPLRTKEETRVFCRLIARRRVGVVESPRGEERGRARRALILRRFV